MEATDRPLAATLGRLARLEPWWAAQVGVPTGPGWFRTDRITIDHLRTWIDALARSHGGHRDVAGSYLGGWLAGAVITVPLAVLVIEARLPDPTGPVWVHRHADGWFDRVSFERAAVLVAASDGATEHPDSVVVERAVLVDVFARSLFERIDPMLEAVRSLTPFGLRGLWGGVADEIASAALGAARAGGTDVDLAWRTACDVIDAITASAPWLRSRPAPFPVAGTLFTVKGTCCLYYKTQPGPPDPCGESYCTTCPKRDDGSRRARLTEHLQASS